MDLYDEDIEEILQQIMKEMKMRGFKIQPPGQPTDSSWLDEKNLFRILDFQSSTIIDLVDYIRQDTVLDTQDKLDFLLFSKKDIWGKPQPPEISNLLKDSFYVDGAIKLSKDEICSLAQSIAKSESRLKAANILIETIKSEFAYPKGDNIIFRGPKYYFMFDGLRVDTKSRTTSVNDYNISELNFDKFIFNLTKHYNLINKSIYLASNCFMHDFIVSTIKNKDQFCKELLNKLAPKKIKSFRRKAYSEEHSVGHKNTDEFFKKQWNKVLDELDEFRILVHDYRKESSKENLENIFFFIVSKGDTIRHAKITFGLDIDNILNSNIKIAPSRAHRKLILGLLDAKINVLAFIQNLAQIIYSDDFLNTDFSGSLVFNNGIVKNIKKICTAEFLEFKTLQKKIKNEGWSVSLLAELEDNTALYMDVLLNDNNISYARLAGQNPHNNNYSSHDKHSLAPIELRDVIELASNFFHLLDSYHIKFEEKEKKLQEKNSTRKKSEVHMIAKRDAWKKLIRIYREENDPLVMILTAQHAMNMIKKKGFSPKKDVLHVMSVNYGGALVGLYAKHTFSRVILDGQVLANNGALVYSIYDVKNANTFSKLSDYPFSTIAKDQTLDVETRKKLKQENWLLIFDDNTNSGETLENIRQLAIDSDFYGRIDSFTCRANADIYKYKKSLTTEQRLDIFGVSGLIARKAKIISSGERYKELIGTIVGNNLFKILHRR